FFDRVWCRKDLDYHHQILSPDFRLTALWQNTSLGGAGQADREVSLAVISRWIHGFPDLRISIEEGASTARMSAATRRVRAERMPSIASSDRDQVAQASSTSPWRACTAPR